MSDYINSQLKRLGIATRFQTAPPIPAGVKTHLTTRAQLIAKRCEIGFHDTDKQGICVDCGWQL